LRQQLERLFQTHTTLVSLVRCRHASPYCYLALSSWYVPCMPFENLKISRYDLSDLGILFDVVQLCQFLECTSTCTMHTPISFLIIFIHSDYLGMFISYSDNR
jgi:hypothetical protein